MSTKIATFDEIVVDGEEAVKAVQKATSNIKAKKLITGAYAPLKPQVIVVTEKGNFVTCSKDDGETMSKTAVDGTCVFDMASYGTWTFVAINSKMHTSNTATVDIDTAKQFAIGLSALPDFKDASWAQIKEIVGEGNAQGVWNVGDTKTYQDAQGVLRAVEIVDFGVDEDNKIYNVTLDLKVPYYSGTGDSCANWCKTIFYNSLPADFKSVISECSDFAQSEATSLSMFTTDFGRAKGLDWWLSTQGTGSQAFNYVDAAGNIRVSDDEKSYYFNPKIIIEGGRLND